MPNGFWLSQLIVFALTMLPIITAGSIPLSPTMLPTFPDILNIFAFLPTQTKQFELRQNIFKIPAGKAKIS